METVSIKTDDGTTTAEFSIDRGFNCYQFITELDGERVDVIDADDNYAAGEGNPSGHGIPLLFPFPNRVRKGTFTWDGVEYEMPESLVGYNGENAIHGFCLDRPWRVIDKSSDSVTAAFQLSVDAPDRLPLWPTDFIIEVKYQVRNQTLWSEIRIKNPTDKVLPWGFGTHAYFKLPLGSESNAQDCLIEADVHKEWELADYLPTGNIGPIQPSVDLTDGARFGDLKLDNVLTDWIAVQGGDQSPIVQSLIMDERAGLQLVQRCDPIFRELVAYTPPGRDAVCLEPYTCVTDAINLQQKGIDAGWEQLAPGAEVKTWIAISIEKIMV